MPIRIVFMGSPDFALPSLVTLAKTYQLVGVVTQPDRASGRGRDLKAPPIKALALSLNIPVMQPQKMSAPESMAQLRDWNPDLIVVAAFGQILKKEVLNMPRYGCINVHASLLPRWRGAAPINAALLHGDSETGVTIMKMDEGLDTGPTLARKSIVLGRNDTAGSVTQALSTLGADLLIATLPEYFSGNIPSVSQPLEGATYAPMLKKEDGLLNFTHPAIGLERRVRAMNPWPGAWLIWNGNPLKVLRASTFDGETGLVSGARFTVAGIPAIQSTEGALLLEEVQPAGRKMMSGKSFLAGARDWSA